MTFTSPTVATDQIEVLQAIVTRLRAQYDYLNEGTCFIGEPPKPGKVLPSIHNNTVVVVSPGRGKFRGDVFEGAGVAGLFEETDVVTTIYSRLKQDRYGHSEGMLTSETNRGLLDVKKDILIALTGYMLQNDEDEPEDILIALPMPQHSEAFSHEDNQFGMLVITWTYDFMWDLTPPTP
jgi:hypothetical protein